MFKLVVLSALLALAAARPSLYESSPVVYSSPIVQEHSLASVGAIVKSVPTAVSHQSSTVVHNAAHVVEPIVAPVVSTYAAAPVVHSYAAPAVAPLTYGASHLTYGAQPIHYAAASPLTYSAAGLW